MKREDGLKQYTLNFCTVLGQFNMFKKFLNLVVVSTILYSMLFVSYSYCGACCSQIELSISYVIFVQKSSSGDEEFRLYGRGYYLSFSKIIVNVLSPLELF